MRQRISEQGSRTLRQIYKEGTERLSAAGVPDAPLDAWLLLSHVTGVSRAVYYGEPERQIDREAEERYLSCIGRRCERIPLQHITGEQEFMGYPFRVNGHVLIPRQDTETLAEEALRLLRPGMRLLDLCTGSGCILLSLLKAGEERSGMEGLLGTGADISEEALETARENGKALGVNAEWIRSDLFDRIEGKYDMILSNPPYIPTGEIDGLQDEVRLYDPRIALDGGEDGLCFYRRIVTESGRYMKKGGHLLLETGSGQGEAVSAMMRDAGYGSVRVIRDLAGLDRVAAGVYNGNDQPDGGRQ